MLNSIYLMSGRFAGIFPIWFLVFSWSLGETMGQVSLNVSGPSFQGTIHDNLSNKSRQGSGFTPLLLKTHPGANLFRDDAVGINFEHIFNGAKEQRGIRLCRRAKSGYNNRSRGAGEVYSVIHPV